MSETTNRIVDDWGNVIETREQAMRSALRNPDVNWPLVSPLYQTNLSFLTQFIRECVTLPSKKVLERVLSQEIRLSREVALAFLSRSDFGELYFKRQLFLPENLNQDAEVVMQYVRKIPRVLQQADSILIDNVDIVLAAVGRDGLELQYASQRLQCDETVVRAACSRNPLALDCCWSATREKLLNDKEFLLQMFMQGGGDLMRKVKNPALLLDTTLWAAAVVHGLSVRFVPLFVPPSFSTDFWVGVLSRNAQIYSQLDSTTKKRIELVLATCNADNINGSILEDARSSCPSLFESPTQQRRVALAVARHARFVEEYLGQHAAFTRDEEFMVAALQLQPMLYRVVDCSLKHNVNVAKAAMSCKTAHIILKSFDSEWLQAHPDVAVRAMEVTSEHILTANAIPPEVWLTSRELAFAWTRNRCAVLGVFAPRLLTDRELALAVAANYHGDWYRIGSQFRSDPEFLKEAVTLNGWHISHLPPFAKNNMELRVRAFVSHPDCIPSADARKQLSVHVSDKLALLDTFKNVLLKGVHDSASSLHALHIDPETTTALKRRLAEWLGVPTGPLAQLYRKCEPKLLEDPLNNAIPTRRPEAFFQIEEALRQDGVPTRVPRANDQQHPIRNAMNAIDAIHVALDLDRRAMDEAANNVRQRVRAQMNAHAAIVHRMALDDEDDNDDIMFEALEFDAMVP